MRWSRRTSVGFAQIEAQPAVVAASQRQPLAGRQHDARRGEGGAMGSSRPPRSTSTASVTLAGRPKSNSSLTTARIVRPV
jgi:hypothetical protein